MIGNPFDKLTVLSLPKESSRFRVSDITLIHRHLDTLIQIFHRVSVSGGIGLGLGFGLRLGIELDLTDHR